MLTGRSQSSYELAHAGFEPVPLQVLFAASMIGQQQQSDTYTLACALESIQVQKFASPPVLRLACRVMKGLFGFCNSVLKEGDTDALAEDSLVHLRAFFPRCVKLLQPCTVGYVLNIHSTILMFNNEMLHNYGASQVIVAHHHACNT